MAILDRTAPANAQNIVQVVTNSLDDARVVRQDDGVIIVSICVKGTALVISTPAFVPTVPTADGELNVTRFVTINARVIDTRVCVIRVPRGFGENSVTRLVHAIVHASNVTDGQDNVQVAR